MFLPLKLIVLITSFLFVTYGLSACAQESKGHKAEIIQDITPLIYHIESTIILPSCADKLSQYSRFYAKSMFKGRSVIEGRYISVSWSKRDKSHSKSITNLEGAYITTSNELPLIMDGGCGVITLYFDIETNMFIPPVRDIGEKSADARCNVSC